MFALDKIKNTFYAPVDASGLAILRIGFGIIMMWDVWRYWNYGWIERYFISPDFHFKYYGLEWVNPWPGDGMYIHFSIMGILAFFITVGFLYRLAMPLFTVAFSYMFFIDQSYYLNHFYLVMLVALLMCFIPANACYSIDATIKPRIKHTSTKFWHIGLLRTQFEIVYIYAGIVKINSDWLQLEPLSMWLAKRADFPILGTLFLQDWSIGLAAYGIILLHIVGAPLLLWKKTRLYIFLIYAAFHSLNHFVFNIGIFPWFTLLGTLVFFDPDWPKQIRTYVLNKLPRKRGTAFTSPFVTNNMITTLPSDTRYSLHLIVISIWFLYQVLMPLRHVLYPGNVSWTEEGHRYAWQMKLRDKKGHAQFYVSSPDQKTSWRVDPHDYLSKRQARKMATRPDMILQFAHFLRDRWAELYQIENVAVRVIAKVSLNGRPTVAMIDPLADLAREKRNLRAASWILPLNQPLDREAARYRNYYKEKLGLKH